jgi:hypothetical protein
LIKPQPAASKQAAKAMMARLKGTVAEKAVKEVAADARRLSQNL